MSPGVVAALVAGGGLVLAGLAWLWAWATRQRLALHSREEERLWATTRDGWSLPLYHFPPPPDAPERRHPVILCHGLQANRFNLDFLPDRSLARAVAAAGFHAFVVELRGSGEASAPPGTPHGGFDAHLQEDLPAILDAVCERTGAATCLWVGHSMGGMLAYAASGRPEGERLAGFVAVGSPGTFAGAGPRLRRLASLGRFFSRGVRLRRLLRALAPLAGWLGPWPATAAVNARNIEGWAIRRIVYNLLDDLHGDLLQGFSSWILEGRFGSRDGSEDYLEGMRRARTPALLLAGAGDRLVPPPAVQAAAQALGERAELRVLGRATGYSADYGHGDLLLGPRAPEEVYPQIVAWLVERDAAT